ncbi:ras association domain-containing protein 8-like isoform X2 [Daphnia carinata]|uniref:ras association domain-containing protein 8-like isoform X2 n=1 Tax=Daphnia carinata TaxID=120202 RepID=UPI002868F7FC|nr:ras association domain-containing protein 8-like isoform X2 [Daphnia carinata]
MELKVWVEGIQRVVCGVCDRTTCQDVVYALAHATGKTGRFTLIERWRNNERLLAPHEHPLKVLMKWGEYSSDVHFILQRTALDATANRNAIQQNNKNSTARPTKTSVDPLHGFTPPMSSQPSHVQGAAATTAAPSPSKDLKKSLTFSGGVGGGGSGSPGDRSKLPLNVGIVRGVPKRPDNNGESSDHISHNGHKSAYTSPTPPPLHHVPQTSHYREKDQSPSSNEGQLVYPRYDPPLYGRGRLPAESNGSSSEAHYSNPPHQHYYSQQQDSSPQNDSVRFPPPYRNPPPPFAGSRQPPPPPYREPPRPSPMGGGGRGPSPYRSSPAPPMTPSPGRSTSTPPRPSPVRYEMSVQQSDETVPTSSFDSRDDQSRRSRRNLRLDLSGARTPSPPSDPQQAQLIQRVNRQRGALDEQQEKLIQLEQELLSWEEKLHRQLDEERQQLNRELTQLEDRCRQQESQLSELFNVEADWEQACREGQDLTEELARLKSDVSALDSQLNECEPTLRLLRADVNEAEEQLVKELESELARVRSDLDSAGQQEHNMNEEEQTIGEELAQSDTNVRSLRSQMDQLTQEIKQANLQSLSIAPADDLKILLEGHNKTGHSRRMLGSPRQLENPVPTNKNPHGVWV